jgi:hypothetical protein
VQGGEGPSEVMHAVGRPMVLTLSGTGNALAVYQDQDAAYRLKVARVGVEPIGFSLRVGKE